MLLRPNTAFYCNLDPRGGTNYVWEFDMLSSKSGTADRGFRVSLSEEGADQNEQDFLIFRSGQFTTTSAAALAAGLPGIDGVDIIQAFNGFNAASGLGLPNQWVTMSNTAAGTPAFVTNNVWAHYKIEADAINRTFKFYINDMVTPISALTNYLSRPQNLPVIAMRFANEGNSFDDGYTLIDNAKLTVDGEFIDLATGSYTDGFEAYTASTSATVGTADNNPGGAWLTAETTGIGNNNTFAPTKVQVVDSSVTAPHSGSKCLMVSQSQTAGISISWAQPTNEDVQITWWAKVPGETNTGTLTPDQVYLRVSIYGWEANYSAASDTMLFGYGHRASSFMIPNNGSGTTNSIITFNRWFSEWFAGGNWGDTLQTYTPDTWEEYQVTTDVRHNSYDLVKNPSSTPVAIVTDGQYISSWGNNKKMHTIGFSTSNQTTPGASPPTYVDDITIAPYTNTKNPPARPYTPTMVTSRFTNYTVLTIPGRTIGGVTVDPRDNTSILFTIDEEQNGSIWHATKVASGNWVIDSTPVVSNQYNPNSLVVETNGTLWWVYDAVKGGTQTALRRLKQPWASSPVEEIVTDFGSAPTNRSDQACALVFVPSTFSGTVPQLAVLDRGVDGNNNPNAIWLVNPATTSTYQFDYNQGGINQLVAPNDLNLAGAGVIGGNANGIAALPATGELVTIWEGTDTAGIRSTNGIISAIDGSGAIRYISTSGSGITWGAGIAVDPTTGRIWVSDRKNTFNPSAFNTPQIVSFDSASVTPGDVNTSFIQELTFPNIAPSGDRPDRHIDFKDPGLAFSTNGSFLVVSDQSPCSGGSRMLIFHNEAFVIPTITITNVSRSGGSASLAWTSGGAVNYAVQRSSTVNGTYTTISPVLTGTTYTDTTAPAGTAFYRVQATAQN
ncbi:MAG: hypothetical protein PHY43_04770 [Verrucomicrobiales bacterium]|nr:hypothetical protein [Verrucomicrobiales bacterium]